MNSKKYNFRGRSVLIAGLMETLPAAITRPFSALLPAYGEQEISECVRLVAGLLDLGCNEISCVGSRAEELHDLIDEVVEDREQFDVVTTFDTEAEEACEYFLFTAGAGESALLAMVSDHPEIVSRLESIIANHASGG
jgi:hypothetical protein